MEAILRSARNSRENSRDNSRERDKEERVKQRELDSIEELKILPFSPNMKDQLSKMSIILNMLTRKNKIDYEIDVDDFLEKFPEDPSQAMVSDTEFENRVQDRLEKFEKNLIDKELCFQMKGDMIRAPDFRGCVKMTDLKKGSALKLVWQGNSKFSGARDQNIDELLSHLNNIQETYRMTEPEFKTFLLRHCTKTVFRDVLNEIKAQSSVDTMYNILQFTYASGLTPVEAKEKLKNFRGTKEDTVITIFTRVRELVSKSFQEFPENQITPALIELESIFQFINAFPEASSQKLTENLNRLQNRGKVNPTLTEFLQFNKDIFKQLNFDLRINGVNPHSGKNKHYNSFAIDELGQNLSTKEDQQVIMPRPFPFRGRQPRDQNQNFSNRDQQGQNRSNFNQRTGFHQRTNQQGGNYNQRNQNSASRFAAPLNRGVNRGKYCSLCGQTSHSAVDGCYKMRNDQYKLINVTPVQSPCPECKTKIRKDLYHPMKYCFLRDSLQKFKMRQ